ncbi:MAG: FAD-binding oxidoreductase, partial [Pseudomonadota bacterium]
MADAITAIRARVGPKGAVDDPEAQSAYLTEWRDRYRGAARLIVRPADAGEVADVVRLCAEAALPITPQGGGTGLVGGQIPTGPEVLISLSRLNRIRALDPAANTATVEAGCILQSVQEAAREADRLFPLSLASEGSAQIGGLISANAGGVAVLRYGTMRDLVLGIEAVLPDGRRWNGLSGLRKNNTGYDLKQLFIGAEGTLGLITAATLKLFPKPAERAVAL